MNNLAGNRNDIWILTKNAREFPVNTKEQSRQPSGAVSSSFLSLSMIFSRYFCSSTSMWYKPCNFSFLSFYRIGLFGFFQICSHAFYRFLLTAFRVFSVCSQLNPSFSLTYFDILRYAVHALPVHPLPHYLPDMKTRKLRNQATSVKIKARKIYL